MIIQICVKLMLIWIFCLDANIESNGIIACSATPSYSITRKINSSNSCLYICKNIYRSVIIYTLYIVDNQNNTF